MKGPLVVIGMLSVALGVTLTLLVQRAPAAALAVGGVDVASTSREAACTCDGGECVQGRCVMSGACSRDSDCDDGLPCTAEWCVAGACTGGHRSGACELKDADAGVCEFGFCERPTGSGCVTDLDCAPSANACLERACLSGACMQGARAMGSDCACSVGLGFVSGGVWRGHALSAAWVPPEERGCNEQWVGLRRLGLRWSMPTWRRELLALLSPTFR